MKRLIFGFFCIFYIAQISHGAEIVAANSYDEHLMHDVVHACMWRLKVLNSKYELISKQIGDMKEQLKEIFAAKSTNNESSKSSQNCIAALSNPAAENGVYLISIPDQTEVKPFYAYCMRHPETKEAWTVIQQRINGNIDFYKNWSDYKNGFGDLGADHWLGLQKIHALTNSRTHKLWIELGDFENATHHAYYDRFAIADEEAAYALNVLGHYSGDAGDSLSFSAGHKFATEAKNCEGSSLKERNSAWWFNYCAESNLNGEYLKGTYIDSEYVGLGVIWHGWHGRYYSLKYAHMAIRPVD